MPTTAVVAGGSTNARLTCHLGLIVPAGCSIRCGDEWATWQVALLLWSCCCCFAGCGGECTWRLLAHFPRGRRASVSCSMTRGSTRRAIEVRLGLPSVWLPRPSHHSLSVYTCLGLPAPSPRLVILPTYTCVRRVGGPRSATHQLLASRPAERRAEDRAQHVWVRNNLDRMKS